MDEYPNRRQLECKMVEADNGFYGISPSEEIEGTSRQNKVEKIEEDKKRKKNKFFVKSLSKIIHKSKTLNIGFNDDAKSCSDEKENDENCNVLNMQLQKQ